MIGAAVLITVPQIYYCIETTASHEMFVYLLKLFEISLHISKDQREISNTSTRPKSWIKHNERFVELNTFLSLKPFSKLSFAPSEDQPNEIPGSESKCHERILLLLYKPPTTQASFIINCGSPSFFWKKMKIFAPLHWTETRRQGAD